jgi:hypothetical protein
MNPASRVLLPLVHALGLWVDQIRRSAVVKDVQITLVDTGVQVQAAWEGGSWKKVFTNEELLGHTAVLSSASWKVPRRPCFWARQIISDVLIARGAG